MAVEVVAVRWSCWACEATAITAPEDLPKGWFEWPAPPWRTQHRPRHCCPLHAREGRRIHKAQWAAHLGRTHVVSAAEFEAVRVALASVAYDLDRLRQSGQ